MSAPDPQQAAEALIAQGKALIATDLPRATDLLNQAVKLFWAVGDQYRAAAEIGNYGWTLRRLARPDLARTYLLNAADLFQRLGLADFAQRHRAAAEQEEAPALTAELLAGLPPAVLGALERGDRAGLQAALDALPLAEQQLVFDRLSEAGVISLSAEDQAAEALAQFAPLLEGIAAVARGAEGERAAIEQALAELEHKGWLIRNAVLKIWQGERRESILLADLDAVDRCLVERVLEIITVGYENI